MNVSHPPSQLPSENIGRDGWSEASGPEASDSTTFGPKALSPMSSEPMSLELELSAGVHGLVSLVCTRSQPFPARGGAPLRNLQTLEALKSLGTMSLFSLYKGEARRETYPGVTHWTHCDLNHAQRTPIEKLRNRLRPLRPYGHYYTDWIHTSYLAQQFAQCLAQVCPQLIVFEELWLVPYLPVAIAYRNRNHHCTIVLDNHNVEGALAKERGALESSRGQRNPSLLGVEGLLSLRGMGERLDLALRPGRVRRLERWALGQVDQMWVCSEADRAMMRSLYGLQPGGALGQKLHVVPNGVNITAYGPQEGLASNPAATEADPVILFLGSFAYGPNRAAAQRLIHNIYPQIRQQYPAAKLLLVGHEPTVEMQQFAENDPQIIVTGSVPSVMPYLHNTQGQAKVMVVPLDHGSGTRLKLLEAFAAKVPVVTTAKGAEGLEVVDGEQVLLRESDDAIVAGVTELLTSPDLAEKLSVAAYRLVERCYSWEAAVVQIQKALGAAAHPATAPQAVRRAGGQQA